MAEEIEKKKLESQKIPHKEDPGIMETVGSFPVWMLKGIDLVTPSFLIKKSPPDKDSPK